MTGGFLVRVWWLMPILAVGARGQQTVITVGIESAQLAPFKTLAKAQEIASRLYASIGIKLKWSNASTAAISMCLDQGVPESVHPGALGYAAPYGKSGTRIHVIVDRLTKAGSERLQGALLGHVMAHELGHVLEGFSRHAEMGVMKAHWDEAEYDRMLTGTLEFTAEDADWIRAGVARLERGRR